MQPTGGFASLRRDLDFFCVGACVIFLPCFLNAIF
jgi:hypothetical protein